LNKYDLIIFDCDGTLVDSEILNNTAVSEGLVSLGMEKYTPEYCLNNLAGCSRQYVNKLIEEALGYSPDFAALSKKINDRCLALHQTELKATAGTSQLLEKITLPKCVASNGNRRAVLSSLAITKLDRFFAPEHIFTGEMVAQGKPAPDIFLLAAKTLGHSPSRCLVIEDSVAGITAAKAAGMTVIGFCGGMHNNAETRKKMQDAAPDYIVEDVGAVAGLL
jgi:HAD superfamily hydrolase (TIGR01509 family)